MRCSGIYWTNVDDDGHLCQARGAVGHVGQISDIKAWEVASLCHTQRCCVLMMMMVVVVMANSNDNSNDDNRTVEDGLSKSILPIEIVFGSSNAWESLNSFGSFKSIF